MLPQPGKVALVVVRAWTEGPDPADFRARVTVVPDVDEPTEHVVMVGSAESAATLVRSWLLRFSGQG